MKRILIITMLIGYTLSAAAQKSEVFVSGGKAIKGYDPVAFFKQSKAVKGADSLAYEWNGAIWLFANTDDLNAFKAEPEKYAPQYGGYCAYGTADGHKAPTQTETWTIVNNKLYFNYNTKVKETWMKDQQNYIMKADQNWPEVKKQQ